MLCVARCRAAARAWRARAGGQTRRVFFDTVGRVQFSEEPGGRGYDAKTDGVRARELEALGAEAFGGPRQDISGQKIVHARVQEVFARGGAGPRSYEVAIRLLARRGSVHETHRVFEMMEAAGHRITPHMAFWMLYAMSRRKGYLTHGLDLVTRLAGQGLALSPAMQQSVLRLYAVNDAADDAREYALAMRLRGVPLETEGYLALLSTCATMEDAGEVVEAMRIDGVEVGAAVLNALFRVCTRGGEAAYAESILRKIADSGYPVTVSQYTALIKMYGDARDLKGLSRTYDRMQHSGVPITVGAYHALITALIHWAADDEIRALAETAASHAMELATRKDATHIWLALMAFHSARGDAPACERLMVRLESYEKGSVLHGRAQGHLDAAKGKADEARAAAAARESAQRAHSARLGPAGPASGRR